VVTSPHPRKRGKLLRNSQGGGKVDRKTEIQKKGKKWHVIEKPGDVKRDHGKRKTEWKIQNGLPRQKQKDVQSQRQKIKVEKNGTQKNPRRIGHRGGRTKGGDWWPKNNKGGRKKGPLPRDKGQGGTLQTHLKVFLKRG